MPDQPLVTATLDALKRGGAPAAEVLLTHRRWETLDRAGALASLGSSVEIRASAYKPGGASGHGTGQTPKHAAERALADLATAKDDPQGGPSPRPGPRPTALGISDRRYPNIDPADRDDVLETTERVCIGLGRLTLNYRQSFTERAWATSLGAHSTETQTYFELTGSLELPGGAIRHALVSRHFADIASLPFGQDLKRRALPLLKPLDGPLPDRPVLLEPFVMAELVRAFAPCFVAGEHQALAPYFADKAPALAPPLFHMTDDRLQHAGVYSTSFDDLGVTPVPLALVREGRVAARLHTPRTARAFGTHPTGHVREGRLQASNLVIRPGTRTRNMMLADLPDALLLDAMPSFDPVTGVFSGRARFVQLAGGEPIGAYAAPVQVTLPALMAGLIEVAADQERHLAVDSPTAVLASSHVFMQR